MTKRELLSFIRIRNIRGVPCAASPAAFTLDACQSGFNPAELGEVVESGTNGDRILTWRTQWGAVVERRGLLRLEG
jgi:hypothetical protein